MQFNSFVFLLCVLPLSVILYHLLCRISDIAGRYVLIVSGIVFYSFAGYKACIVLGLSIMLNYLVSRLIRSFPIRKKAILFIGVLANVLSLVYYKYTGFIIANINSLSGSECSLHEIVLPLGISFFTFQQIASEYPDVDFCYFFTPYCIAYWADEVRSGDVYRQVEAMEYATELMLEYDNIHVYSFNNLEGLITNLDNYEDLRHYGEWVNSAMLKMIHDKECLLSKANYKESFERELALYTEFDYESLNTDKTETGN